MFYVENHKHKIVLVIALNPAQVISAQFGQTVLLLKLKIS